MSNPDSSNPIASSISFLSSSSKPDNSSSILTHSGITSAFSCAAYSFTFKTNGSFSALSIWLSEIFATYNIGFVVNKNVSFTIGSSSSLKSNVLADFPSSNVFFIFSNKSISVWYFLSAFKFFLALSNLLFTISRSANINSKLIVSISLIGSTLPSTCTTFPSSKHLTTSTIASVSLICDKNLFPRPSPLLAPLTNPAMSTNSITACVVFCGLYISVNLSNLSSGTGTTPTFGSIVQNG